MVLQLFNETVVKLWLMVWIVQNILYKYLNTFSLNYQWFCNNYETAVYPSLMVSKLQDVAVKPFFNFPMKY